MQLEPEKVTVKCARFRHFFVSSGSVSEALLAESNQPSSGTSSSLPILFCHSHSFIPSQQHPVSCVFVTIRNIVYSSCVCKLFRFCPPIAAILNGQKTKPPIADDRRQVFHNADENNASSRLQRLKRGFVSYQKLPPASRDSRCFLHQHHPEKKNRRVE